MHPILKKPFSWLIVCCLSVAWPLAAQQDTTALDSALAADSASVIPADSTGLIASDSTAPLDSLASPADSGALESAAGDSSLIPPRTAARPTAESSEPARKPASSPGALPVEVIDWDWDDYTHVIEIGLRNLDTDREYELEKDSIYTEIWERQKGKRLWVWGEQKSLGDGFWALDLEKFEPLLTMAAADSLARADSIATADSISRADSIAAADSVARADSIATADSIAAAAGTIAADSTATPGDSSAAAAQAPAAARNTPPAQAANPVAAPNAAPADSTAAPPGGSPPQAAGTDSTQPPKAGRGGKQGGPQP